MSSAHYVYILRLCDGTYLVGLASDLRLRILAHRDRKVKSTAGKNPKLVWFRQVPNSEAASTQVEMLRTMIAKNPRAAAKLVLEFKDIVDVMY